MEGENPHGRGAVARGRMVRARRFGRALRLDLDVHACFWVSVAAMLVAAFAVPQISHLFQTAVEIDGILPFVIFWGFNGAIIAFYLVSFFVVLGPYSIGQILEYADAHPERFVPRVIRATERATAWLRLAADRSASLVPRLHDRFLAGAENRKREIVAAVLLAIVGVAMWSFGALGDGSRSYRLAGALCRNASALALLLSLWLAVEKPRPLEPRGLAEMTGRGLSWLVVTLAFGELLWLIAASIPGALLSFRIYSIWAMLQIIATIGLLALLVDRMHRDVKAFPVRPVAVSVAILSLLGFAKSQEIDGAEVERYRGALYADAATFDSGGETPRPRAEHADWVDGLLARIRAVPLGQPVVIVAASGGGSRAAIFSALVLEALERTPIAAPQGSASEGGRNRSFGSNVVLVSAVSGGSLATANYVVEKSRGRVLDATDPDERVDDEDRLLAAVRRRLATGLADIEEQIADVAARSGGIPGVEDDGKRIASPFVPIELSDPWRFDPRQLQEATERGLDWDRRAAAIERERGDDPVRSEPTDPVADSLDTGRETLRRMRRLNREIVSRMRYLAPSEPEFAADAEWNWTWRSRAFDRMCIEFMAPMLRGILSMRLNRGDALARFWNETYGWHGVSLRRGYPGAAAGEWAGYPLATPYVFLNSSDVARGRRLICAFPALKGPAFAGEFSDPNDPTAPLAVDRLEANLDVALARAVRMSSNFPFGFSALEFGAGPANTRALDGGIVDNTGLDSIAAAFSRLALAPEGGPEANVLRELAIRGLLLVEIDAGAKPSRRLRTGNFAGLSDPLQALGTASQVRAEADRDQYLETIRRIVDGRRAEGSGAPQEWRPFQFVRFECSRPSEPRSDVDVDQVMTAWTLGPYDKADTLASFLLALRSWQDAAKEIRTWAGGSRATPRDAAELAQIASAQQSLQFKAEPFVPAPAVVWTPSSEQLEILAELKDALDGSSSIATFEDVLTDPGESRRDEASAKRRRLTTALERALADPELALRLRKTAFLDEGSGAESVAEAASKIAESRKRNGERSREDKRESYVESLKRLRVNVEHLTKKRPGEP